MARPSVTSNSRASTLAITAIMVVPALFAALATATAPNATNPSGAAASACSYGSGDVCLAMYNGPDALMGSTGETTLGVNPHTGAVMMSGRSIPSLVTVPEPNGQQRTARILFDDSTTPPGITWQDATNMVNGVGGTNTHANLDPMLWTDTVTGRTMAGADSGSCTLSYAYTDDDGHSWNPLPPIGCAGVEDHPTIGSGPYHGSAPAPGPTGSYPTVWYFCQQHALGLCITSTDGGVTWGAPTSIGAAPCATTPGTFGHLRVGPDGTAYVATGSCDQWSGGARSVTNGASWTGFHVPGLVPANFDTSIAPGRGDKVDGGRLYYIGNLANGHAGVATSVDHGATWTAPIDLDVAGPAASGAAVGVKTATFTVAIAGDDDRAAVTFLGTRQTGNAFDCSFGGTWDLFVAYTYDGGRTWTSYDAGNGDPVQIGGIWPSGGVSNCRNLYDFDDIAMATDGRVVVGYSDACIAADGCHAGSGDSTGNAHNGQGSIVRQFGGKGLLAAFDTSTGQPAIHVSSPSNGATLPATTTAVSGDVNRVGAGPNQAPVASFVADVTTGAPPLAVQFTAAGTDADGSIASWVVDYGDATSPVSGTGAVPANFFHTYSAGTFTAKLTVTDDRGASASAQTNLVVSALPTPDATLQRRIDIYDAGQANALEVASVALAPTTGDHRYLVLAGSEVAVEARWIAPASSDGSLAISTSTPCSMRYYDASGAVVLTHACRAFTDTTGIGFADSEGPTLPQCIPPTPQTKTICGISLFQVPTDWAGTYYVAPVVTVAGVEHIVRDQTQQGLLAIRVVNPAAPTAASSGHVMGDPIGDVRSPAGDLSWADAAIVGDKLVATIAAREVPSLAAANGATYVLDVNGEKIGVRAGSSAPELFDASRPATPVGTVAWNPGGVVAVKLDLAWLHSIGKDCPCVVSVESYAGSLLSDRMPDTGAVAVPLGSSSAPEATDPARDIDPTGGELNPACGVHPAVPCVGPPPPGVTQAISDQMPWADITAIWLSHETPTTVNVTMQVRDMSSQPKSLTVNDPSPFGFGALGGVQLSYNVHFCLDNNPNPLDVHGFCYLVSAVNSVDGAAFTSGGSQQNGDTCGASGMVQDGVFDTASNTVTWRLLRAGLDIKGNSADVTTCSATSGTTTISYPIRGGVTAIGGTTLSQLSGYTGLTVGLLATDTAFIDQTNPATSTPYVFGEDVPALAATIGGPYSGAVGGTIPIAAVITGGHAPYSCAWTSAGGAFGDASSCSTTVTYSTGGAKALSVVVTDARSSTTNANGVVSVSSVSGERVAVYVDSETVARGAVSVSTSASNPSATWNLAVDLSDLSGPHTLHAKWIDTDGTLLAAKDVAVTLETTTQVPFVQIDNPANDAAGAHPLAGTTSVSGTAGHRAPQALHGAQVTKAPQFRSSAAVTSHQTVLLPCVGCDQAAIGLSGSTDWLFGPSGPDSTTDVLAPTRLDGAWFSTTGFAGGHYTVVEDFGATPNVYFYANSVDINELSKNVGPDLTKSGTVPPGANWAFVYISAPTPAQAQNVAGAVNTVTMTLTPPATAPSKATAVVATPSDNAVALAWTASSDDGGAPPVTYHVFRDGGEVGTGTTATTFTDTGLLAGTTYSYTIDAVNAAGLASGQTAPVSAHTTGGAVNQPPSAVSGLAASALGSSSIRVTWTAATDDVGVDHYEVHRGTSAGFTASGSNLVGTTGATSFVDSGLAASTTYDYIVLAVDGQGAVGPATAAAEATTDAISVGTESVTLFLDGASTPFATVSVASGAWGTTLDTTTLADGSHTVTAAYDDGAAGSASATNTFFTSNGASIAITSPTSGATVDRPITISGTTSGTAPSAPAAAVGVQPSLAQLTSDLSAQAGFLGVAPAMDGATSVFAYFSGAVPSDLHASDLPAPWTVVGVPNVELKPAIQTASGVLSMKAGADAPPVPSQASGIGPGSHLLTTMDDYPGTIYGCTANFVWKDDAGNVYLGAAGHCWLPAPATGQTGPTYHDSTGHDGSGAATSDPLWNYDLHKTHATVCVSGCTNGGQSGFIVTGTTVDLGPVVFARANGPGDDFGIVKIPSQYRNLVRTDLPVWHGPHSLGSFATGDVLGLYGNAAGFGETFPTMARGGYYSDSDGKAWRAVIASFEGDSGSAVVGLIPDTASGVHGDKALGILTHLSVTCCTIGTSFQKANSLIAGTTITRAEQMTLDFRGVSITPLMSGDALPTPASPPGAPTGLTPTPGSGQVALSWTAPAGDGGAAITGYTVKYGTSIGGPYPSTKSVAGTSTTVTGLTNGITYYFVVVATNSAGTGPASTEASATPVAVTTVPDAPANLQAFPSDGSVGLSWTAPANGGSPITQYTVSYGATGGPLDQQIVTTDTSAIASGLVNDQSYSFVVTATNAVGTGPASNEATATPHAAPATSYHVDVRLLQSGTPVIDWTPASYDGSAFSHAFAGVAPGAYTAEARLSDATSVRGTSSVDFTASDRAPVPNAGPDQSANEGSTVQLAGSATDPDGDAMTYAWTQVSGPTVAFSDAASLAPSFTAPGVNAATDVVLRLTATDAYGTSASDDVTVSILDTDSFGIDTVNGAPIDRTQTTSVSGTATIGGHAHLGASVPQHASSAPSIRDLKVGGKTVTANAGVASPSGARVLSYVWSYGDGAVSVGPHARHTYLVPGSYPITLTIRNGDGIVSQARVPIVALSGSGSGAETYYLHKISCNTGQNTNNPQFMDRTASSAKEAGNGCGSFGTGMFATDQKWDSHDNAGISYASGSTIVAHVQGYTLTPSPSTTLSGVLRADNNVVATGSATMASLTGPVQFAGGPVACGEWTIAMTTTAAIPTNAVLQFEASTPLPGGEVVMCYTGGATASRLDMVSAGSGGTGGGSSNAAATIVQPADGANVPSSGATTVSGTASFPPSEVAQTLFVRRDGCGTSNTGGQNTDNPHLSPDDGSDAGDGCSFFASAATPAAPLAETYPLEAASLPITLSPTGHVTGKLYFGCEGADPFKVTADLLADGAIVGTQDFSGTCAMVAIAGANVLQPTENAVDIALNAAGTGHPLSSFTLRLTLKQAGAQHWTEMDTPASYLNVPVTAPAVGKVVQVAIDDPTFAVGLAVSGTDAWTATWNPIGIVPGSTHTIYARAGTSAGFGTVTSHTVTVGQAQQTRTAGVQLQIVPAGQPVTLTGWTTAPLTGDQWSFAWDTSTLPNDLYDAHARETINGAPAGVEDLVTLQVANSGRAPIVDVVADQSTAEAGTLSFDVRARDLDGHALALSIDGLPGAVLADHGDGTGTVTWTPTYDQAGAYTGTVQATDATENLQGTRTFHVAVANTNRAPTLAPIGAQTIAQDNLLTVQIVGSDPDADPVTYALAAHPAGMSISGSTLTWRPTFAQLAGDYAAEIVASDGTLTASTPLAVHVLKTPRAPVLDAIAKKFVVETSSVGATVHATNPDGDAITLTADLSSLPGTPSFVDHGDGTATFSWTPQLGTKGLYTIRVTAEDFGLTATKDLVVQVWQLSSMTLTPIGSTTRQSSPGHVELMWATIKNTGPERDVFHFATAATSTWHTSPIPTFSLGPNDTMPILFFVTVPATGTQATASITATSGGNPNVVKSTSWSIVVPLRITVDIDSAPMGGPVTGTVSARFLDGERVPGVAVSVYQVPRTFGTNFDSQVIGQTNSTGVYRFEMSDTGAGLPDTHDVTVTAQKNGRTGGQVTSYTIERTPNVRPPPVPALPSP